MNSMSLVSSIRSVVVRKVMLHTGREINVLGKSGAHKVMLLAAVAFNLKKYLKFKPSRAVSMVIALER